MSFFLVISLLTAAVLYNIMENTMKVKKAVILAAGKGTRFLPYTKAHPKEMLAVIDRPSLQLIVEEVVASGIKDVMLVISPEKEDVKRYFTPDAHLERELQQAGKLKEVAALNELNNLCNITFAYQPVPNGTGRAVALAKEWTCGEPFAVLNGDDFILNSANPVTLQLVKACEETGGSVVGVQTVDKDAIKGYATCKVESVSNRLYKLDDIIEKPKSDAEIYSLLAPLGRYVFTSDIFDEIDKAPTRNGEVYLTDAIRSLLRKGSVYAYDFEGTRYDFGDKLGYLKGVTAYALGTKQYGEQYRRFLTELLKEKQ